MKFTINESSVKEVLISGQVEHEGIEYYFWAIYQIEYGSPKLYTWGTTERSEEPYDRDFPRGVEDKIQEFLYNDDEENFEVDFMASCTINALA